MGAVIKIRLLNLNKKQVHLLDEIKKRGYPKITPCRLNNYINGRETTPQAEVVLKIVDDILSEWEEKARGE